MGKQRKGSDPNPWHRAAILSLVRLPLLLPYSWRGPVVAWLMSRVFAPLARYDKRVIDNLKFAVPEMDPAEMKRLSRAVPANTGRMLIEIASGEEFVKRIARIEMQGPGLPALDEARESGRPIIIVSGHFGNHDAARAALANRGHNIGALYRPVDDPVLDQEFLRVLNSITSPIFPRGRKGLGAMLRFLRKGNAVAILMDQFVHEGAPVTFFGKPARTSTSAAEMALKYDALLVPVYGIRNGSSFDIVAEDPIPHTDALTMTQAINDSLEARVRAHMDQWLWIHRRWKPDRQRTRAAARIAPGPSD